MGILSKNNKEEEMIYKEIFSHTNNNFTVINHNKVIQNFLNRSIIEPDYFKVYSSLLSFKDFEFYVLNCDVIYKEQISFKEAYLSFQEGILLGVIKQDKLMLNPSKELLLEKDEKLISVMRNKFDYSIVENKITDIEYINIQKP